MTINPCLTPQLVAQILCDVARTSDLMQFVGNAIHIYFQRVTGATHQKLVRYGLRPVISPMVAEQALDRVAEVQYSEAYIHGLVANDGDVAVLALRAVQFYARRYSSMDLAQLSNEVGESAMQIKAAASILMLSLDDISIEG